LSLEHELLDAFQQKQWTLAFAESCTGGDLAARLTKIPEASKVFLGGIIAYSGQIKKGLLAVSPDLTPDKIVSEQMAQEMVKSNRLEITFLHISRIYYNSLCCGCFHGLK